jgi:endogenous inhibitor of DNA gyrase (YacG/DUF329 family)
MGEPSDDARTDKDAEVTPLRPPRPCPICGEPSVRMYYPFSSKRCADIDLNRWLSGTYAIPAVEAETGPDEAPGTPDDGSADA